jgi:cytoskeletal protein RodZ
MFEIGPALREARERRGLGYNQVEAAIAIRSRYVRALEDEQFDILPGPTYTKGFLRAYAEFLGLDGQLFVDEFNSRHHDPRRDLEQPIYSRPRSQPHQRRRQRRETNLIMIALAAIVAVASLFFIASTFHNQSAPQLPPPSTTPHAGGGTGAGTGAGTGTGTQSSTTGGSTGQTTTKAATHKQFHVVLTATNPCWVVLNVGAPTGKAAATTHGTSLGGYTIDPAVAPSVEVASKKPLFLSQIGSPASLTITVDGHAHPLPAGTTSATVLRIDQHGVHTA